MKLPHCVANGPVWQTAACLNLLLLCAASFALGGEDARLGPYEQQVAEQTALLQSGTAAVRLRAAEALGLLRAREAEQVLLDHLEGDSSAEVRCQAAVSLGWCGSRRAVDPLICALGDDHWMVRQAAWVALTNLTAMELPFDSLDPPQQRATGAEAWRRWWRQVPENRLPDQVLRLLERPSNLALGRAVTASTTYKGPPEVLTDGQLGPAYWQTKFVEPPQWCQVDLGRVCQVAQVVVHQYSERFAMTGCEVALSVDGKKFQAIQRFEQQTPVELVARCSPQPARYVRIISFGSVNPTYPTTFFEIEVFGPGPTQRESAEQLRWRLERGLRAAGALGGPGTSRVIIGCLGHQPPARRSWRPVIQAGCRALGRLGEEEGFQYLVDLLDNTMWARFAAEALGDFGDPRAVPHLIEAYPKYCKKLDGSDPERLPADDRMRFPSEDRMLETPYQILYALSRLPLDETTRPLLRRIAPLVMANLPGDHDTFILYEPEVAHRLTRHVMEAAGLRQQACEHALVLLGQPRRVPPAPEAITWPEFAPYRMASWLPAVCTEADDLPRLLALLQHEEGFVRLNAAKAIAWLGDRRAIEPLARLLQQAPSEASFGYSGTFKDEEYRDRAPRWREGPIRALGLLGAHGHTDLLVRILNDEGSVVEVRRAAAQALADLGNRHALEALRGAAESHPLAVVRQTAQEALWLRGLKWGSNLPETVSTGSPPGGPSRGNKQPKIGPSAGNQPQQAGTSCTGKQPNRSLLPAEVEAVVFIKGSNSIPNTIGTVEQADRWRATYVVTDSGPEYRPGRNLYLLRPHGPCNEPLRLTPFDGGYVASPEVSPNGTCVLFTHRGEHDPWWHVWRINVDGTGLVQLTDGPYHDVGPSFLPDGRIVFASSRLGIRDEYHGYPCTALYVMNADGSRLERIATNIGRDNEPAVLFDGRVVFSRLEVFYSRNKTELTLHAVHPDGTRDVVLYGPERRAFWRKLNHGPPTPADGQEAPLTHRVLRMTQPQPMPGGRGIVVVTQGGLVRIGPRRDRETFLCPDYKEQSYTTPFPLPDGRILCAGTRKVAEREKVDLALYVFDPESGERALLYNDPQRADFEPRPVMRRPSAPVLASAKRSSQFTGRLFCSSVFHTQEELVRSRGRLVRLVEGQPVVQRHSTQTNPWPVWKNHGGTFARVLGVAPLAPDGSFYVEVPADRLLHFQVLDSDGRVVGNQLTWIYPRPGETKSCVGCHEKPHTTPSAGNPAAAHLRPLRFLPTGGEFSYRAKAWFKGYLPAEIEERTRTVRAVNLLAR